MSNLNETILDVRGLEPPEPMIQILSILENLPPGAVLVAQTDRKPMHLLDVLVEKNYPTECLKNHDASYITTIIKR